MQYEILKMDEPNQNNVVIERKEIEKFLNEIYDGSPIMCPLSYELIKSKSDRTFNVLPEFVSHKITDLWIENDYLIANIEILDTGPGLALSELMNSNEEYHFVAWYYATVTKIDTESHLYATNIKNVSCFPIKASDVAFD